MINKAWQFRVAWPQPWDAVLRYDITTVLAYVWNSIHFPASMSVFTVMNTSEYDFHYSDVIMDSMASQITSLTIAYSAVYSGENQRKHQSSASLAFVGNSPVTGEFSAQMASNAEIVSIWWRHHAETAGNIHHLRHRRMLSDIFVLFCFIGLWPSILVAERWLILERSQFKLGLRRELTQIFGNKLR